MSAEDIGTIEQRALDLLCGECDLNREDYDEGERVNAGEALRAVVAALTSPEGWVLMPVETTAEMLDDAYAAFPGFGGEDEIDAVYAALIAARPEVP
jgi:hypothetical protein